MSTNPFAVPAVPYIGVPFAKPNLLCNPLQEPPTSVVLTAAWANYGVSQSNPNAAFYVDLSNGQGAAQNPLIRTIRGIYIDNTGSDVSVYVNFPDTYFTVTCPPYSTVLSPVITNGLQCQVTCKGAGTNDASATNIYLLNYPVSPGADSEIQNVYPQWRASPSISRGLNIYNNGYSVPAIGDQWTFANLALASLGAGATLSQALFNTPYTQGGTITLTNVDIRYFNKGSINGKEFDVSVVSNGLGGTLYSGKYNAFPTAGTSNAINPPFDIFIQSGLQLKLNAAETWSLNVFAPSAFAGGDGSQVIGFFGWSYQGPGGTSAGSISTLTNATFSNRSIGPAGATQFAGFKFTSSVNAQIVSVQLSSGTGSGATRNWHAELWLDSGGSPSVQVGSDSASLDMANFINATAMFTFPTPPTLQNGNTYWIVFSPDNPADGSSISGNTYTAADAYGAGRASAITGLVAGNLPGGANEKWKMAINYQTL